MPRHVVFVAPFFLDATLRFLGGATRLEDVALSVISQDPLERIPADTRPLLAGHWRVDDALDPGQLVAAARSLATRFGPPSLDCSERTSGSTRGPVPSPPRRVN